MPQVTIGPEFFNKSKNDYGNWRWALVREFYQNSIDCGSKTITFDVSEDKDNKKTTVVVCNDGVPMSVDELVNKLLSLGGSGKNFSNGSVGGFGKAKEILYFCHLRYEIKSGNLICAGSGANYDLEVASESFHGTKSTVEISGNYAVEILELAKKFVSLCNAPQKFFINGELQNTKLKLGRFRGELPFGRVYTSKQSIGKVIVRINGIPMFYRLTTYRGCVVLELNGTSIDVLCANRDSLRWEYSRQLDEFVVNLATNRKKALKPTATYTYYTGKKLQAAFAVPKVVLQSLSSLSALTEAEGCSASSAPSNSEVVTSARRDYIHSFVVKNETGRTVKGAYLPDSGRFSKYAVRLTTIWSALLLKLHEILKCDQEFSVGFVFSEDCSAQFENHPEFGRTFLINPVKIEGSSWKRKFKTTLQYGQDDLHRLAAYAAHEMIHGLGLEYHDEVFAYRLTEYAAKLLSHHSEIRKCFKTNV